MYLSIDTTISKREDVNGNGVMVTDAEVANDTDGGYLYDLSDVHCWQLCLAFTPTELAPVSVIPK